MQRCINVFGLKEREKLLRDELYVMLMLMRSEGNEAVVDCDDPMTVIACTTNTDACPAACREDAGDNTVVKAGDLAVSATPTAGRKAIIGGVSDLDTLTLKTSEEVTISKIVLERYGYSKDWDVESIRLEDEDGNMIADEKDLNSKGQVTLNLKKGYRTVDGNFYATVVVKLDGEAKAGSTIGFKVVDVESTAENVDLRDYSPYTYDTVVYNGSRVVLTAKGTEKSYNYEAGESYEISRFKVKAADSSALLVKGFTLTMWTVDNWTTLDAEDFIDEVEVTADGEKVAGLKYSFNDQDELVVSFDDVEVAAKKTVTFVVSSTFDELDEYGSYIKYEIAEEPDFNAVEKKTWARVVVVAGVSEDEAGEEVITKIDTLEWPSYLFNGGKTRLTNTKLGNIDAPTWASDIVVAEGSIETSEAIKWTFELTADTAWIEALVMTVNGVDYDAKVSSDQKTFTFKNVELEKSWKIQFKADIDDEAKAGDVIRIDTFKASTFSELKYVDTDKKASVDLAGSISFSKITINTAKATLENNLTKAVEFVVDSSTTRKPVFDGTYTAKKSDINLNVFTIDGTKVAGDDEITLYVSIDGEEVGDVTIDSKYVAEEETFSDIVVKAGKSVSVKVEAEFDGSTANKDYEYTLELKGDDKDGNEDSGKASDTLVTIKTKTSWTITIDAGKSSNTYLLKGANKTFASFTVKPSNSSNDDLTLDDLVLVFDGDSDITADDIRVKVAKQEISADDEASSANNIVYAPNEEINNGVVVEVVFKKAVAWEYTLTVTANGKTKEFKRAYAPALVEVSKITQSSNTMTKFELSVQTEEDDYKVSGLQLFSDEACSKEISTDKSLNDEITSDTVLNIEHTKDEGTNIRCVKYNVETDETTESEAVAAHCEVDGETVDLEESACVDVEAVEAIDRTWVPASGEGETAVAAHCEVDGETVELEESACVDVEAVEAIDRTWVPAKEASTSSVVVPVKISATNYSDYFKVIWSTDPWRVG